MSNTPVNISNVLFLFKCNLPAQRHNMATQRVRHHLCRKLKLNPYSHPPYESQLMTCCGLVHLFEHTTHVFNVDMPTINNKNQNINLKIKPFENLTTTMRQQLLNDLFILQVVTIKTPNSPVSMHDVCSRIENDLS